MKKRIAVKILKNPAARDAYSYRVICVALDVYLKSLSRRGAGYYGLRNRMVVVLRDGLRSGRINVSDLNLSEIFAKTSEGYDDFVVKYAAALREALMSGLPPGIKEFFGGHLDLTPSPASGLRSIDKGICCEY